MSTSILEHDEHDEQAERRTKFLANYQAACAMVREAHANGGPRPPVPAVDMPEPARVTDVHFQGSRLNGTHCLYIVPHLHAGSIGAAGEAVTDALYRDFLGDPELTARFFRRLWQDFSQEEINAIAVQVAREPIALLQGQIHNAMVSGRSDFDPEPMNEEIRRCEETAAAVNSGRFRTVVDNAGLSLLPEEPATPSHQETGIASARQTAWGKLASFLKRG